MRIALIFVALLGAVSIAQAQRYVGFPYYRSSTAGESYARGFADVIRSVGEQNLRNSEAARNYEEARSRYLDNRLKGTETYFEMRRINRSYRDERRRPRLSSEQLHRIAARGKPERLDPTQLDPITGVIEWPLILQGEAYKDLRDRLERQFAGRAESSGVIGLDAYQGIQGTIEEALAELRENIEQYSSSDYITAKRFLESLAHEARFPIS